MKFSELYEFLHELFDLTNERYFLANEESLKIQRNDSFMSKNQTRQRRFWAFYLAVFLDLAIIAQNFEQVLFLQIINSTFLYFLITFHFWILKPIKNYV